MQGAVIKYAIFYARIIIGSAKRVIAMRVT